MPPGTHTMPIASHFRQHVDPSTALECHTEALHKHPIDTPSMGIGPNSTEFVVGVEVLTAELDGNISTTKSQSPVHHLETRTSARAQHTNAMPTPCTSVHLTRPSIGINHRIISLNCHQWPWNGPHRARDGPHRVHHAREFFSMLNREVEVERGLTSLFACYTDAHIWPSACPGPGLAGPPRGVTTHTPLKSLRNKLSCARRKHHNV
ncbi:hypothetical protein MANES_S051916v8 [Manihot esculenta]|uniref:Uncharacterized protein n=3 Tax=Manihot esculenta TaxID=3983 RepID=A0ACB7FVR9_MANES|nr:hypothetical protein MANES_S042016v8 [Manihot esculenta]KAG8611960.1 hypothetical protein MANES_S046216v8 [Manihot esculenta]KAG8612018.1 hypothetical protein MANES_S051916v8 [Manihot esculenta]